MNPDRLKYNRKLVGLLERLVEENPDLRFGQLLESFGFVCFKGNWYDESTDIYDRVLEAEKRINDQLKENK